MLSTRQVGVAGGCSRPSSLPLAEILTAVYINLASHADH
jgi:hypothetical protein